MATREPAASSTTVDATDANARASVYAFLAVLFGDRPTEEAVRAIRGMAEELDIEGPGPVALDELEREYMDLFVVPNQRYVAPYESVFRDRVTLPPALGPGPTPEETGVAVKGLLLGDSALAVRQCYDEAGISLKEVLPDHIATELRFMAWLWHQQAERGSGDAAAIARLRATFRADHVSQWIAGLRERVAERERLGFYTAALRVAEAVLARDT